MGSRKGSIPIPYIIALIFGIAVIAILGYWFFVVSTGTGAASSDVACNTQKVIFCQRWTGAPTADRPLTDDVLRACAVTSLPADVDSLEECRILLGIS